MMTWLALLVLVLTDCIATILMAGGVRDIGKFTVFPPHELLKSIRRVVTDLRVVLGIFNMTIAFFMLIFLLLNADISFVWPATALTEPINMLGSKFILKERVTRLRWLSMVFIFLGVTLISIN
jgi:drug/metabolite transporter (DMT)-like permease